jgi:iron(III) transport system substrate-binding protein
MKRSVQRISARAFTSAALTVAVGLAVANAAIGETLRVISDRTPGHLEQLFERYEATTGTAIEAVFVDKGLLPRLQSRPKEADVVISKTAVVLEAAKQTGLLSPFPESLPFEGIAPAFSDPDRFYLTTSYRPRVIFYSKDRVDPSEVANYEDLTDPAWHGRVCIRSGYHNYNLSLWAQMAATKGLEATQNFLAGLHANLARPPSGNDRAQVRAIMEGVCDVALANSYYMGIMLANPEQRAWAEASELVFPNQREGGAFILRGGAGMTTANRNPAEASRFLEYLLSAAAQQMITHTTFAYSVRDDVPLPEVNRTLGKQQPEVTGGRFKVNFVPLEQIYELRPEVVKILDELDFDNP